MSQNRDRLQSLFGTQHRFPNFGEALCVLRVNGFRCHQNTVVEIGSPITAFCGLNGTGKSTLLQLAAVAYKSPTAQGIRYYIKDFIVPGTLDPSPFLPVASVEYAYWKEDQTLRRLTVTRSGPEKRWRGYRSQPARNVYFAGMGLYIPKIEERDFVIRDAAKLHVVNSLALTDELRRKVEKILGCQYQAMHENEVSLAKHNRKVITASRNGVSYSEANMGCGEGRIQHIVRILETLPERSLVLLEEPETSLHQRAEFEFGLYLIDVCIRKKHQVFLTTHSESLLAALPAQSRVYIDRTAGEIRTIPGVSSAQAASMMAGGALKALVILVEDEVAKAVLIEMIRRIDRAFLSTVAVEVGGDKQTLEKIARALVNTGLRVAVVRDGDQGAQPKLNLYKLPGAQPPEREILQTQAVGALLADLGIHVPDFFAAHGNDDHHSWFAGLAAAIVMPEAALVQLCARTYAAALTENEVRGLVDQLKEAVLA